VKYCFNIQYFEFIVILIMNFNSYLSGSFRNYVYA